ncbi:hypothetical protein FRC04_007933 [Tulasnella sp. 424]|nr:hypothetical protein FRC04_007933 [Tulasnella sp. 424]KAG8961978.1 hypothetical protein FRC05_005644 [Tulasnella sp. 425]
MKSQNSRLNASFWKSSKLSLAGGKRLYRSAFGIKALSNVNDKAALAKKASNPPVHVNWEAVISPTEAMEQAFTSQENEFYTVLRDLVGKGEVNPAEWGPFQVDTVVSAQAVISSVNTGRMEAAASTEKSGNLYIQVIQDNKPPSQAVLCGFTGFTVEDGRDMARTPLLVACILDQVMLPFKHTMRFGVQVQSFFEEDVDGSASSVMWFAKLERLESSTTAAGMDVETIEEGRQYRYRNVIYEVCSGTVAVAPYKNDAGGFRLKIFTEEWVPDAVIEAAAARSKAEKKAQKEEEKKGRDRCAIGYLHAEHYDNSTMDIIRRIRTEKQAKKVIRLSFQDMLAVARLKGEIRGHFRTHHANQSTIPWINPDPGFTGRSTQVTNRLKSSTTFPEDHQLQEFYSFGSSWLSNLNSFSAAVDEIEENGTDELIERLDSWKENGMIDKGLFSGLEGDKQEDIEEGGMLEQGADSWKTTMKIILQTALKQGLVTP